MNTIETMRMFCDGRMSQSDVWSLLLSMGHPAQDIADAFVTLADEEGSSIRVGKYEKGEYHAELYLTAR